ncbi:hypothetical protein ACP275_09G023300 [Erythranthe tilingii]
MLILMCFVVVQFMYLLLEKLYIYGMLMEYEFVLPFNIYVFRISVLLVKFTRFYYGECIYMFLSLMHLMR